MLSFGNDYSYGACPEILDRLARTNDTAFPGYGSDAACEDAKRRIREACETPDADVWFLVGGTQTNQTVIDTMLAPYEGVVTVDSGHPNVHEAGAIESTGHKVITLPHHAGKLDAAELDDYCATFYAETTTSTWCSPDWSTSRTPPSTARSTARPSLRSSPRPPTGTACRCSWTAHDSATD